MNAQNKQQAFMCKACNSERPRDDFWPGDLRNQKRGIKCKTCNPTPPNERVKRTKTVRVRYVTAVGANKKIVLNDKDKSTEIEVTAEQTVKEALLVMFTAESSPSALDDWSVQALVGGRVVDIDMTTALAGAFKDIVLRRKEG